MLMMGLMAVLVLMPMTIPVDDDVDDGGDGDKMMVTAMEMEWGECDDMEVEVGGDAFLTLVWE